MSEQHVEKYTLEKIGNISGCECLIPSDIYIAKSGDKVIPFTIPRPKIVAEHQARKAYSIYIKDLGDDLKKLPTGRDVNASYDATSFNSAECCSYKFKSFDEYKLARGAIINAVKGLYESLPDKHICYEISGPKYAWNLLPCDRRLQLQCIEYRENNEILHAKLTHIKHRIENAKNYKIEFKKQRKLAKLCRPRPLSMRACKQEITYINTQTKAWLKLLSHHVKITNEPAEYIDYFLSITPPTRNPQESITFERLEWLSLLDDTIYSKIKMHYPKLMKIIDRKIKEIEADALQMLKQ